MRYYTEDGQPAGETIVHGSGITGTTDWTRFTEFRPLPPEVAVFQPVLWVYPNGRRPSSADGTIRFAGLQNEAP